MNTKKLKQLVLDLAIHGKLVSQDPNDEPASELLKRIQADVETRGRASNKSKEKKSAVSSVDLDEVPFEVPSSWCWTTIGSISSNILYGVNESAKEFGRYKLLRITDIQENKVDWNTVPFTDFDETKVCDYLLQKNDILFARTGATVGKSYLVEEDVVNCIYASYLIKVQANTLLNPKYVKRYFESAYYWNQISDNSIGTGQPNVNGTILASLTIPLPPLAEQHRIVAAIEKWFAVIDQLEKNEADLKKSIEQTKKKVLDLAIRGKLVAQDPEDEPAGELLKRIKEEKAKTTKGKKAIADVEIDEVPFELPKGWEWCTIDCISKNVLAGGDKPDICQKQKNEKCDIPIYANAVQDDGLYGYTNIPTQPDVPAITVSARGTIGFVCVRRHPYTPIVRLISLIPIYVDVDYLAMALNSIITTSEGSSIPQLTVPSFKTMLIPLPPLSEQKRIVEKIEEVFGVLERIEKS